MAQLAPSSLIGECCTNWKDSHIMHTWEGFGVEPAISHNFTQIVLPRERVKKSNKMQSLFAEDDLTFAYAPVM